MRTSYRIKKAHREAVLNRQRRIALGLAVFALMLVWALNALPFGAVTTEAADESYKYIQVRSGDTIWSIAGEYRAPGTDIRAFVDELEAVNNIDGDIIYSGQTLKIPN